jgi:hypothetical protein
VKRVGVLRCTQDDTSNKGNGKDKDNGNGKDKDKNNGKDKGNDKDKDNGKDEGRNVEERDVEIKSPTKAMLAWGSLFIQQRSSYLVAPPAPPFSSNAAWAAARRAVRTRKGEQET